ncbi:hypothetical protein IV37_GL000168 [Fructilactobacillus fructivorans]|uniref:DUF1642 domain-containing protein n=1 Tax=Fructilactobacillus fructivorans TaxID=1614 RepID=UPI0007052DA0|nr:DUF1642 domain-containing protein [Fructilactobacillus fructivorans]KRN13447.1 hypothetical protein IV37_GL000168 [Fructilactobacillus fructivorans]
MEKDGQKVKVPQFVAGWIERNKDHHCSSLGELLLADKSELDKSDKQMFDWLSLDLESHVLLVREAVKNCYTFDNQEYVIPIPNIIAYGNQAYLSVYGSEKTGKFHAMTKNTDEKITFTEDELDEVPEMYRKFKIPKELVIDDG